MLEGSRLLDAPPHHVEADELMRIVRDFEFVVLFTSTPGFPGDIRLAAAMKDSNPRLKIAFVGPHVTVLPERSLRDAPAVDFIVRREFDYATVEFARGEPIENIAGISYRRNGSIIHNPDRPPLADLDALPDERTFTRAISMSGATTCPSCCTPTSPSTPRGAVRHSARFACGRRR